MNTTMAQIWATGHDCNSLSANGVIDALERMPDVDVTQDWGRESTVFEFADGSAIVVTNSSWDLRAPNCVHSCWDGVGCNCVK